LVVLGCQVRREAPYCREAHDTVRQPIEDDRKATGGAACLDAVVGFVFGVSERRAVGEEGRESLPQVELSRIDLAEMRDEIGQGTLLAACEPMDGGEEVVVGESRDSSEEFGIHGLLYHEDLATRPSAPASY
jgi:hypothetical protein